MTFFVNGLTFLFSLKSVLRVHKIKRLVWHFTQIHFNFTLFKLNRILSVFGVGFCIYCAMCMCTLAGIFLSLLINPLFSP